LVKQHGTIVLTAMALVVLVVIGTVSVGGFASGQDIRSMLLFASFLGIAAVGQTLCALVGGLDLSIPYVIGFADVSFLWLLSKRLSSLEAILVILLFALVVGVINGFISARRPSDSLIVTLGSGFAVLGLAQWVTSSSLENGSGGNVPSWLQTMASIRSNTFGVPVAPSVILWLLVAIVVILALRRSWIGRGLYALGGNQVAARLIRVPEVRVWMITFGLSAVMAASAGILLLGFSGGAYADVGQPYLFETVAAVIIGGTSLSGGKGGYGLTILGVGILTVLTTLLIGFGLSTPAQEAILGLLIVPTVALYGRQAHPRTQV
jgi:ribose transport system permease protein